MKKNMAGSERSRAAAQTALDAYRAIPGFDREDNENTLKDLIADLMHLADSKGLDGEYIAGEALDNYLEEKEEESPGGVIEFPPGAVWLDPETGEFHRDVSKEYGYPDGTVSMPEEN